jgi:site-specific DNA recombinase
MPRKSTVSPAPEHAPTAIAYIRVSSNEQAKGYSLVTQEQSVRAYCAERGYDLLAVFPDAHTGTELQRPGLTAAMEAVAERRPAVIVLHDVDRLGRDRYVQAIAEHALTRFGARLEYVLGGRSDSDADFLGIGVKQLISVVENRQRVERSRRGKNGRAEAGGVLVGARPPYGYRAVSGRRTGTLVPDETEAAVVADIYRWYVAEGLSCYAIAKRLKEQGVPTRGDTNPGVVHKEHADATWRPDTIAKMLRNETYMGQWHWGKTRKAMVGGKKKQVAQPREEWRTIAVPALVDEATWRSAQRQLRVKQATSRGNAKRDYLLRGLVFCPGCGRRWGGRAKTPTGKAYYRCPTTEAAPWRDVCAMRYGIEQRRLEGAVCDALRAFLLDPAVRAIGVAAERARLATERDGAEATLAAVDTKLAAVDAKLGALLDEALTDGFPAEIIDRRKRDLLAERTRRLRERDQALARLTAADQPDLDAAIAALAPLVEQAFAEARPEELRRVLDLLRVEVHVVDRETVRLSGVVGGPAGQTLMLSSG